MPCGEEHGCKPRRRPWLHDACSQGASDDDVACEEQKGARSGQDCIRDAQTLADFDKQIGLPNVDPENLFFLTVGCIHCPVKDPVPFDLGWISHSVRKPACKCEIGVSMEGNIAWVSTPHRGSVHDVSVFRKALRSAIPDKHRVIVAHRCCGPDRKVAPLQNSDDEFVFAFKKLSLAQHDACTNRIKDFKATSHCFKQDLPFQLVCFNAVSVLCQCNIENGEPLVDTVGQVGLAFFA